MKVRRDFYLKQLEHRMHDGLVQVVTGVAGTAGPRVSDEGIVHVGIVPFLLDPTILDNALAD